MTIPSHRPAVFRAGLFLAAAIIAVSIVTLPSAALRHLKLLRSFPAADTVLTSSPDAIRLWLSEPAESAPSKISLATGAGAPVAMQAVTRDTAKDAPLAAKPAKALANGAYKVTWKAMSRDGHVVTGTFGFRVDAAK